MRGSSCWFAVSVAAVLSAHVKGCGQPPDRGQACDMHAGDLVVSEVMAGPLGDHQEWFEVYNATDESLVLDRVTIAITTSRTRLHDIRGAGTLRSHQYFVLGGGDLREAPIDYSYGYLPLANSGATITVSCRGEVIDVVRYGEHGGAPTPISGMSLAIDGGGIPDASHNDDADVWCIAAEASYDGVNMGTPGEQNASCGLQSCLEDGVRRPTVGPSPGDLVFTEIFADPSYRDGYRDWVEVYAASDKPVDINSMTLLNIRDSHGTRRSWHWQRRSCVTVPPGIFAVLAGEGAIQDGVVPFAMLDGGTSSLLFNDASGLQLWVDNTLIDAVHYTDPKSGASTALLSGILDAFGNDNEERWCLATSSTGGFAELGSPGVANADVCR